MTDYSYEIIQNREPFTFNTFIYSNNPSLLNYQETKEKEFSFEVNQYLSKDVKSKKPSK